MVQEPTIIHNGEFTFVQFSDKYPCHKMLVISNHQPPLIWKSQILVSLVLGCHVKSLFVMPCYVSVYANNEWVDFYLNWWIGGHLLRSHYCVVLFLSRYFHGNIWDMDMCDGRTLLIQGDPWHGFAGALQWRNNGLDGVSNHQHRHCLLSRLFGRWSKKASKLRITGHCAGNSPVTGEFPAQMASNAENASIWWRHYGKYQGISWLE